MTTYAGHAPPVAGVGRWLSRIQPVKGPPCHLIVIKSLVGNFAGLHRS